MALTQPGSMLDDRRIKLLNFLLKKQQIPDSGEFNLKELVGHIPESDYSALFERNPEFEQMWKDIDLSQSLGKFLVDNGFALQHGDNLQLTKERGMDLKKQGSYAKLLEDERNIVSEARRVSELELEADRMAHRQYKINVLIAFGTCMAALYYILEILNGFLGFYKFR